MTNMDTLQDARAVHVYLYPANQSVWDRSKAAQRPGEPPLGMFARSGNPAMFISACDYSPHAFAVLWHPGRMRPW